LEQGILNLQFFRASSNVIVILLEKIQWLVRWIVPTHCQQMLKPGIKVRKSCPFTLHKDIKGN